MSFQRIPAPPPVPHFLDHSTADEVGKLALNGLCTAIGYDFHDVLYSQVRLFLQEFDDRALTAIFWYCVIVRGFSKGHH